MKIIYPYNEILPNKKAHDHFIFQSCIYLALQGDSTTLLCGRGSRSTVELKRHYMTPSFPNFKVELLPIIRKNNFIRWSYNRLFFFFCQRYIRREKPDVVITSVSKQGSYHLKRKIAGTKYIYEVHELAYYPGFPVTENVERERELFASADHLIVTTKALEKILRESPYQITTPISVVPLATKERPLSVKTRKGPLHLFYVGALYKEQGIDLLLQALQATTEVHLSIIGGRQKEISEYTMQVQQLGLEERVHFLGFCPPSHLSSLVQEADIFVAPFSAKGRMPYVAHTKLDEYAAWQRPIIAPDLPVVRAHLPNALFFTPDDPASLCKTITAMKDPNAWEEKQRQASQSPLPMSWEERAHRYLDIFSALCEGA